nr:PREDICTED: uncharacterized protein LOC105662851 [Megachile rotundata]
MAIKLPEMRLPTFDGTIENWGNEDLTPVQKLQYLRSTLTGKAAICIGALTTTDANCTDAIDSLKEKFDCPRRIILSHCDALRNIPKLLKDTPEALANLVDTVNQHLRALKNLGGIVEQHLALHNHFEIKRGYERRANCTVPSSSKSVTSTGQQETRLYGHNKSVNKHRSSRGQVLVTTKQHKNHPYERASTTRAQHTDFQCPVCKKDHLIWSCQQFNELSVNDRKAIVVKAGLCFNCLRRGHGSISCTRRTCRICQGKHHTLLHYRSPLTNSSTQTLATSRQPMNSQETS